MSLSSVDVCNGALDLVGGKEISSLTVSATSSPEVRACARNYDMALKEVLEKIDWNEASEYADLVPTSPSFGAMGRWGYAYALPDDYVKLREVINSTAGGSYEVVANKAILTNLKGVQVRYTKLLEDVDLWSGALFNCVTLCLAIKICIKMRGSRSLKETLKLEYREALYEAGGIDAFEQTSQPIPDNQALEERY